MKKILLLLFLSFVAIYSKSQCNDLFISEYVEGTGNNKAIELFNPTNFPINLADYELRRYSNGATSAGVTKRLPLSGTIGANETYVIVLKKIDPTGTGAELPISPSLQAKADTLVDSLYNTNNMMYFNGNDPIVLFKVLAVKDVIGKIGEDPGIVNGVSSSHRAFGWPLVSLSGDSTAWTKDHTLVRKYSQTIGDTNVFDIFDPRSEWDSLPENTFITLGRHFCSCNCTSAYDTIIETVCSDSYRSPSGKTFHTSGIYNDTITYSPTCAWYIHFDLTFTSDSIYRLAHTFYAEQTGASYQWLKGCATPNLYIPIPGATNRSYLPTDNSAFYSVEVTQGGCVDTSICLLPDTNCMAFFRPIQTTPSQVILLDSSFGAGTAIGYTWDFGDGNTANIKHPTHSYATAGTYLVTLSIYDTLSSCSNTYSDTITVDSLGILRGSFSLSVIKEGTLSIAENNEFSEVKLFPNPTSDFVTIQFQETQKATTLEIRDVSGKIVYSQLISGKEMISIHTQSFKSGMYIVSLRNANGQANKKLIVQ